MAGGLLRAALRAGNVRQVLSASLAASRRARGVREMNRSLAAGGGGRALGFGDDRSVYGASDYLMRRGRPGKFEPYDAVYDDLPSYLSPTAGGGFGSVSRFPDGRRVMFPPAQSGGALSPFEGGRAWGTYRLPFDERVEVGAMPGGFATARAGTPFSMSVPPWIGRGSGPAPSVGRFASRDMSTGGGRLYDDVLGERQGMQFYAPSIPLPVRDSLQGYY